LNKLLIIALLVTLFFGVARVEAENAGSYVNGEFIPITPLTAEIFWEGERSVTCLTEKLNVRAEPGTASDVVGSMSRGDRVFLIGDDEGKRLDDPSGYNDWLNVALLDGTEGWVARMFVIDGEVYERLEDIERAAKTGDGANTEAAIEVYINKELETELGYWSSYSRSPDGGKFAITINVDDNSIDLRSFIVTVGYGISSWSPCPTYYTSRGEWVCDSKYWVISVKPQDVSGGVLEIYEADSMRALLDTSSCGGDYSFVNEPEALVWVPRLEKRGIAYPLVNGPAAEPDYSAKAAAINGFNREDLPCVIVYEFATGNTYMAAAPDLTTLSETNYGYEVTLKPTERFTANPLSGPVSGTEVYKKWVGDPVNGGWGQPEE
jgi:hypothetical protein